LCILGSDIRDASSPDPVARRRLADLIRDACINVGFFYIGSHGIPQEVIDNAVKAAKTYFSLPEATKAELAVHKSPNFKGYTALLGENTDSTGLGDLHEAFDIGWEPHPSANEDDRSRSARNDGVMTGANFWPDSLPGFREIVLDY